MEFIVFMNYFGKFMSLSQQVPKKNYLSMINLYMIKPQKIEIMELLLKLIICLKAKHCSRYRREILDIVFKLRSVLKQKCHYRQARW